MTSNPTRSLAILAAFALIAGLGAWQLFSTPSATGLAEFTLPQPALAPTPVNETAAPDAELASLGTDNTARVEAESPATPTGPASAATSEGQPAPNFRTILAGTGVLSGVNGIQHRSVSGELTLSVRTGRSGRQMKARIEGGKFEARVQISAEGEVSTADGRTKFQGEFEELGTYLNGCKLDGFGAVLFRDGTGDEASTTRRKFAAGITDAKIELVLAPELVLSVLDRATGHHLDNIEVIATSRVRDARMLHPRRLGTTVLVGAGVSPLPVAPGERGAGRDEVGLLVRAEGYAWKGITINFSARSERTIELVPGGELEVNFVGEVPRKSELRLRKGKGALPLAEIELRGKSSLHLDAIAPATYELNVELGQWYNDPLVLGSTTIQVLPHQKATATLELETIAPAVHASLSGTLLIHPAWEVDHPRRGLRLQRLTASKDGANPFLRFRADEWKADAASPDEFAFHKSALETGKYALSYGAFGFKFVFDLPPNGLTDLRLEIPEPVEITVSTREVETGEEATDVDSISWHPSWPEGSQGGTVKTEKRDAATGRFHFRVPRGPISLSVRSGAYRGATVVPDATHGLEVILDVRISPSVAVELRCGGQRVPWPKRHFWKVEALDGEGHYNSSGSSGSTQWFGVSEPGRYSLTIPEIDGFLPHEPVVIELAGRKRQELIIELTAR